MANNKKEASEIFIVVPSNFDEGFNILGQTLKRRNLIDSIVIGGVLAFIVYLVLYYVFYMDMSINMMIYLVVTFFLGFIVGIVGHNGDPWSIFLMYKFKFYVRRRVTMYNPRVKYEKIAEQKEAYEETNTMDNGEETGQSVYNKFIKKMQEKTQGSDVSGNEKAQETEETYVFEDDIGVSGDVPDEIEKQYSRKKGGNRFGKGKDEEKGKENKKGQKKRKKK